MKQSISIPAWHALAQAGQAPPMRILIQGNSMFPLIRKNRDYVTILPLEGAPAVGDIVLFVDPEQPGRYVLHRLWRIERDWALTWGDNCRCPDAWVPLEAVWGKASLIERGKRSIRPNPQKGMALAQFWHVTGRGYRWAQGVKYRIRGGLKQ